MKQILLCLALGCFLPAFCQAKNPEIVFNRDIRPILSGKCWACHGPDEQKRKAKLRLDTHEGVLSQLDKNKSPESELIEHITHTDPDEIMPPPEAKNPLSASEIELLKTWVAEGAVWQDHWAFLPPAKPDVAKLKAKTSNPIDAYVTRALQQNGHELSPEADRRTLIRRVSYDFTGEPPSPADVTAFVDDKSPEAYETMLDRTLAKSAFGERMALMWMDAARYGDSSVYHADGPRFMWGWRDWVINSYNDNKRFDAFTVEQLAGDLLPEATMMQKVASGFNRNHGTTDEGGAIAEEYRVEYVVDRVKTTSSIWLGLTMECSQCHDHKYDPISQEEYYQFYAFFNNNQDGGMQTRNGNAAPTVPLLTAELEEQKKQVADKVTGLEKKLAETEIPKDVIATWIAEQKEAVGKDVFALSEWQLIGPFTGGDAFEKDYGAEAEFALEKKLDLAEKIGGKAWEKKAFKDGAVHNFGSTGNSASYLYRVITVPADIEQTVSLGSDDGIKVWLNGEEVLAKNVGRGAAADQEKLNLKLKKGANPFLMKISNGGGPTGFYFNLGIETMPDVLLAALKKDKMSTDERSSLVDYYRNNLYQPAQTLKQEIAAAKTELDNLSKNVPSVMIMGDNANMRDTYILLRGHYDSPDKSKKILPDTPSFLPELGAEVPKNRLGLAQWIVDENNPLTARVTVNRYWMYLFGEGLVRTVQDFGSQGDWPSHPELLDWLAADFVEHGWDIKRTLKQMAMSDTYRQRSHIPSDLRESDPDNRMLGRAPRFRLQGEFIRDTALILGGLINPTVGGPSVKPYQPANIWNELSLNGGLRYQPDKGDKLYRKSMYTYWKRSAPHPAMVAFDAPTREKCVMQRARTNTPLQPLVTLNDVQFVEAARNFAQRVMLAEKDTDARIKLAFELATARPPDALRTRVIKSMVEAETKTFADDAERAKKLLGHGESPRDESLAPAEHAAWTVACSAILNLDEVLNRE